MTIQEVAIGEYRFVLDTQSGLLRGMSRDDSPSALGHGDMPVPMLSVDVTWNALEASPIYDSHWTDEHSLTVEIDLGPLHLTDHYMLEAGLLARQTTVRNIRQPEVQLTGLRMALGGVSIGDPGVCRFEAPANVIRPRLSLTEVASRSPYPPFDAHFAPGSGLVWGRAFGDAPDVGPGLLVIHNPEIEWSLLTWYVSDVEAATPFVTGDGTYATFGFDSALAGWLKPGTSLTAGTQYILLHEGPYQAALSAYRACYALTGISPPVYEDAARAADWAALYEVHPGQFGGFDGLRAYLPTLASMGIDTLYLMPIHPHRNKRDLPWDGNWESIGSPYAILDFERLDPLLGTEDDFQRLVDDAHDYGIRVLMDLVMQGSALEARYVNEHPKWYARDEQGQMVHSHGWNDTWSFDWANPDYHEFVLGYTTHYVEKFGIDGFRVDAPHGKEPNWDPALPYHASQANLGAVSALEEMRRCLRESHPNAVLYCELFGPLFTRSHDIANDYHPYAMIYQLFVDKGRLTPYEFNEYLRDYWAIMPPGAPRVCFTETHDTRSWPAYGLRGSDIDRTMLGILVMAGFVPMIWSGQEMGQENFLSGLLMARQRSITIRQGNYLFNEVTISDMNHYRRNWGNGPADNVYTLIRHNQDTVLLGLASLTPERVTYQLGLPLSKLPLKPEATYQLRDLITEQIWNEYGQQNWTGKDLKNFNLTPKMYTPYILEIEEI